MTANHSISPFEILSKSASTNAVKFVSSRVLRFLFKYSNTSLPKSVTIIRFFCLFVLNFSLNSLISLFLSVIHFCYVRRFSLCPRI